MRLPHYAPIIGNPEATLSEPALWLAANGVVQSEASDNGGHRAVLVGIVSGYAVIQAQTIS